MSGKATPDLNTLLSQKRRLIADVASLRDDAQLVIATLQRIDGTLTGLVNEMREDGEAVVTGRAALWRPNHALIGRALSQARGVRD